MRNSQRKGESQRGDFEPWLIWPLQQKVISVYRYDKTNEKDLEIAGSNLGQNKQMGNKV